MQILTREVYSLNAVIYVNIRARVEKLICSFTRSKLPHVITLLVAIIMEWNVLQLKYWHSLFRRL